VPGYPAPSLPAAHAVPHNHHPVPALWGTRHQYHRYAHYSRLRGWTPITYGWTAEASHNPRYWLWTFRLWKHRAHWARKHYLHHEAALRRQSESNPVALGRALAAERGWTGVQWEDLYALWNRESGWNPLAVNPTSGACGIAQRLPCQGGYPDARSEILDGLSYIHGTYGDPAGAWAHSEAYGWY
jgi:hypothetical protein